MNSSNFRNKPDFYFYDFQMKNNIFGFRFLSNEEKINLLAFKNSRLENNISYLENRNQSLRYEIDSIMKDNEEQKEKINSLEDNNNHLQTNINNLMQKQKEEEKKKQIEKNKFKNFKNAFENDKNIIKNKNITNSKNYITNFIINEFVKEFETNSEKKSNFTKTLLNYMDKFTLEFMKYNEFFIQSFKVNSQNIIKNYNVKDNNISIEHINFIVIGKSGTGKSTFINECLLLNKEKSAKEGVGLSVTKNSNLYCSDKLKMIRIWDTQGMDYKTSQDDILKEVKRIVDDGLKKGPDYYINIILYCTNGNRFQEEDGQLIHEIMKLYPMDNLPVIITQLQAYFEQDAKYMEKIIKNILANYLEHKIVEKIEIKSIIARDKQVEDKIYRAKGISELLRCSFDIMGRSITSATFKNFSQDIENLCKNFVDTKINFIQNIFKDEQEILEIAKDKYVNGTDKYFKDEDKKCKTLEKSNIYNKIKENNYFIKNFIKIMSTKFLNIYNNLNNANYSFDCKEKPLVLIFIKDRLEKLQKILNDCSKNIFEEIYKQLFQEYLSELHLNQSSRKKQFEVNYDVIDSFDINKNFKEELFQYFKNEFFKYFFCLILKLFMNNLKDILIDNYKKEIKENEEMIKIINEKAEYSLKSVTKNLKQKLNDDLDKYNLNQNYNQKESKKNFNIDFEFPEY